MKPIFDKSRTLLEKIVTILIFTFFIMVILGSNINLDIIIYAGFGSYIIIGLLFFVLPSVPYAVLIREKEEYLVRNQRKIPLIKSGFRYGGFALACLGAALTYIFIVRF